MTTLTGPRLALLCAAPFVVTLVIVVGLLVGPVLAVALLHDEIQRAWRAL